MHRSRYSISQRLTRMNLLVSGAALLVACIIFFAYDLYTIREAMVRNLSVQAEIVGFNSVSALVFDDPQAAAKTASAIESFPRILSLQIYDAEGRPFAGFWKDHNGAAPPLPRTPSHTSDVHWFDWPREVALMHPINFQGKNYGTVYIRSNLTALTERFWRYAMIMLAVALAALAAAWVVSRTSQRVITKPIIDLAGLAQGVSRDKNYAVRAPSLPERGEITTLVESFNDMLAQIQARDTALREAHDELEVRVVERTAELKQAEENLRLLSGQLLQILDDERRRIARELHDSTGQVLAALAMNLAVIQGELRAASSDTSGKAVQESLQLVQDLSKELRTISYLLHPPLLDEAGLESALRWYVQGFAERSGIDARLHWPAELDRLPRELETAIFRIVQECLTNIHRHSGSRTAEVSMQADGERVRVNVEDRGRGITRKAPGDTGRAGVGIRGMRERVSQLGGQFEIVSNAQGTRVIAILPRRATIALHGRTPVSEAPAKV